MKKETALKRINNAVEKKCKCECQKVKDFFEEIIYLTFVSLENDEDEIDHSSSSNLNFALVVNLCDEYEILLKEAREL